MSRDFFFITLCNDTIGVVIPFLKYVFFMLHILETGSFQYEQADFL